MAKKIVWSIKALEERIGILEYWNTRNGSTTYSIDLDNQFVNQIDLVSIHPFIGKQTEWDNIRYKIVKDYLIFYEILEAEINILSIKDGRQNPQKFKNIK